MYATFIPVTRAQLFHIFFQSTFQIFPRDTLFLLNIQKNRILNPKLRASLQTTFIRKSFPSLPRFRKYSRGCVILIGPPYYINEYLPKQLQLRFKRTVAENTRIPTSQPLSHKIIPSLSLRITIVALWTTVYGKIGANVTDPWALST